MQATYRQAPVKQGGITVTMALLLLVLCISTAAYTANSQLFNAKIVEAKYRAAQAKMYANSGLAYAMSLIKTQGITQAKISRNLTEKYDLSIGPTQRDDGSFYQLIDNENILFSTLRIRGFSDDLTLSSNNHSTTTLQQKVFHRPITGIPAAPIIAKQGLRIDNHFKIGVNPNGAGLGVPISIWSAGSVGIYATGSSCGLQEYDSFDIHACKVHSYSDSNHIASDIEQYSASFPADLFIHAFGYRKKHYAALKNTSKYQLRSCDQLDDLAFGVYWIEGNCILTKPVGSPNQPVLLIIENGSLALTAGSHFNGLIYLLQTAPAAAPTISADTSSKINGALLIDHENEVSISGVNIRYSLEILARIANPLSPEFSTIHTIPGSWQDF